MSRLLSAAQEIRHRNGFAAARNKLVNRQKGIVFAVDSSGAFLRRDVGFGNDPRFAVKRQAGFWKAKMGTNAPF